MLPVIWRRPSSNPDPHQVFTPGSLPLEKHNVYARRQESEEALGRFIARRQVPVVVGDYGVGKTTLVRKFFQDEEASGTLVYVPSAEGLTISDLFRHILEHLNYRVEVSNTSKSETKFGGGLDLKVIRTDVSKDVSNEVRQELVISSPTDLGILRILENSSLSIVVDEMHRASDDFRSQLANWIKAIKGANQAYPRLAIIGTTMDAERLVRPDPGIDRYVKELAVPIMSDDEARYVVETGFATLKIKIPEITVSKVALSAAGAPTIVQALSLEMAEKAVNEGRSSVLESDYSEAVQAYLQDHGRRLASAYYKAIETTGPKRYRKQILQAAAQLESDYVTMDDIRVGVSNALDEDVPSTALSGPLRALKEEAYGKILQDVERVVGGTRIHNLTAFTDPMMKSFVRFMGRIETN